MLNTYSSQISKSPSLPILRPLKQRSFENFHYHSDNLIQTRDYYQLILTDPNSVIITHTKDEHNPNFILFSKCIIKSVLTSHNWKDSFDDRAFSRPNHPQSYNYNDYKMAWLWAFFFRPDSHSSFFNFHDSCSNNFLIWFYHWWTRFGNTHSILLHEGKTGWDF